MTCTFYKKQLLIKSIAFTLYLLSLNQLSAQTTTALEGITPPSPEAAALAKYAETPVGLYTGTPEISIPIYNLVVGDIMVPIALSYHASGNKVEEIASWTGLGWELSVQAAVTRTIIDEPDEFGAGGFLSFAPTYGSPANFPTDPYEKFQLYQGINECTDAGPDQFAFNFFGEAGQFSFGWDGKLVVTSKRKVKIEPIGLVAGAADFIKGWRITTDNGMAFVFEAKETTLVRNISTSNCGITSSKTPPTAWRLTKIISPNGWEIYFDHLATIHDYASYSSEVTMHKFEYQYAVPQRQLIDRQEVHQRITRIRTSSGNVVVDFILSSAARTDLPGTSTERSLSEIKVTNDSGKVLSHHRLSYDYSTGRLTLKGIEELSTDSSSIKKPPYQFTYSGALPPFESGRPISFLQQDHSGYLNQNRALTLLPPYRTVFNGQPYYYPGADRSPDSGSLAGMLTQIRYPAGATTTFEYELHDYSFIGSTPIVEQDRINHSHTTSLDRPTPPADFPGQYTEETFAFTIPAATQLNITTYITKCSALSTPPSVTIVNQSTGQSIFGTTMSGTNSYIVDAIAGAYELKVRAYNMGCYDDGGTTVVRYDDANATLSWPELLATTSRVNRQAGGPRIKRITDYDGVNAANNIVRNFQYTMLENGVSVSSGVISAEPLYNYRTYIADCEQCVLYPYMLRSASSPVMLGSTKGNHVAYRQVNVLLGQNGEGGKTESRFTTFYEFNDEITPMVPFPPAVSNDFRRGFLTKQTDYRYENGSYVPVKQIENDYDVRVFAIEGFKVGSRFRENGRTVSDPEMFATSSYANRFGHSQPIRTKTTRFENGKTLITEKLFGYDSALQFLLQETVKGSAGKDLVTQYAHAQQYTSMPIGSPIYELRQRHILSGTIEKIVKEVNGTTEHVIDASYYQYVFFDGNVRPRRTLTFKSDVPVSNFRTSLSRNGAYDERYYRETLRFDRYSPTGKLLQSTKTAGVPVTNIRGHADELVIAQIDNSIFEKCAYTSFETPGGGWNYIEAYAFNDCRTGTRSFAGTSISSSELANDTYLVSLWAKGPGAISVNGISQSLSSSWTRYEWTLINPTRVTITNNNGRLDDVRLHPKTARMKTFTYDEGGRVTSATDANYQTSFFEYDGFGRLKIVRDSDRNIVTHHQYNYSE